MHNLFLDEEQAKEKKKCQETCYTLRARKTLYVSHSVWLVMSRINYSAEEARVFPRYISRAVVFYTDANCLRLPRQLRAKKYAFAVEVSKILIRLIYMLISIADAPPSEGKSFQLYKRSQKQQLSGKERLPLKVFL